MADQPLFEIRDLKVRVEDKEILKGVSLKILPGEVHALMGPNGSGKSTLSNVILGHPKYEVVSGSILYKGEDVTSLKTDERARRGIFLAFQYPMALPGVTVANFVRSSLKAIKGQEVAVRDFRKNLKAKMAALQVKPEFATRYVNDGFSGGEKKRLEILQMSMLEPSLLVLDETDSGLDIDALRVVSEGINTLRPKDSGVLLITHYQRMLNYVKPDKVHVFVGGEIVRSGGADLAKELESKGYEGVAGAATAAG